MWDVSEVLWNLLLAHFLWAGKAQMQARCLRQSQLPLSCWYKAPLPLREKVNLVCTYSDLSSHPKIMYEQRSPPIPFFFWPSVFSPHFSLSQKTELIFHASPIFQGCLSCWAECSLWKHREADQGRPGENLQVLQRAVKPLLSLLETPIWNHVTATQPVSRAVSPVLHVLTKHT